MNKPLSAEKKALREDAITETALTLFLRRGIAAVKMTDIAESCGVGVATLYRYFQVKKTIVIRSGILLWKQKYAEFAEISKENELRHRKGIEGFRFLLLHFDDLFKNDPSFFLFVRDFDSFCLAESIPPTDLKEYDETFSALEALFLEQAQKGIADGSVRKDRNFVLTYYAFARALLGLGEKLVGGAVIVESDKRVDDEKQISALIDVILAYFAQ
jgi:AcrR family transcriptional regulator